MDNGETLFDVWDALVAKSICPVWYSSDGSDAHCIVKQNGNYFHFIFWGWKNWISREEW